MNYKLFLVTRLQVPIGLQMTNFGTSSAVVVWRLEYHDFLHRIEWSYTYSHMLSSVSGLQLNRNRVFFSTWCLTSSVHINDLRPLFFGNSPFVVFLIAYKYDKLRIFKKKKSALRSSMYKELVKHLLQNRKSYITLSRSFIH